MKLFNLIQIKFGLNLDRDEIV